MRIAGLVEAFNFETSIASDLCGNAQTGLSIFDRAKRLCILLFLHRIAARQIFGYAR